MSLTFPSNPTLGDTYTAASNTWYWDGVKWHTQGDLGIIGPSGTAGSAGNDLPKITGVTYADNTYTSNGASSIAPSTAGYIYLTGSNFQSGCSVYVNGTLMTTTYVSSTRVNVAITGQSVASYHIYFYNPDGGTTVKANGLNVANPGSGGTVTNNGGYTYHAFTDSGTFTLSTNKTVGILVVAGGGGSAGGDGTRPGGGGGGLIYNTNYSLSAGSYTVTIGAGGSSGPWPSATFGNMGNDTTFGTLLTAKGGGGGGYAGGSGGGVSGGYGGGYLATQPSQSGDSGTYGYGNNGSNDWPSGPFGNGGGGAGAAGSGRYGGAGLSTVFIAWGTDVNNNPSAATKGYFAGGGAAAWDQNYYGGATYTQIGGAGGGGEGQGRSGYSPTAGMTNTGGGGGAGKSYSGMAGGSGIVIIRY